MSGSGSRQARERWNVLEHPFYQRWSAGELTREELAALLRPVPPRDRRDRPPQRRRRRVGARGRARRAAPPRRRGGGPHRPLGRLRRGRRRRGRRRADGGDRRSASRPGPRAATGSPSSSASTRSRAASRQISRTKREGLAAHYGIGDGPGNEYFRVHEKADVEHAAEGRSLIEAHLDGADPDALVAAAEAAFKANWRLLDGVVAA